MRATSWGESCGEGRGRRVEVPGAMRRDPGFVYLARDARTHRVAVLDAHRVAAVPEEPLEASDRDLVPGCRCEAREDQDAHPPLLRTGSPDESTTIRNHTRTK
jgi:hypothetical protein